MPTGAKNNPRTWLFFYMIDIVPTDVWGVGGILRVRVDSETVGEECVDPVTAPDPLPRVPVGDGLTVPEEDVVPVEDDETLVTADISAAPLTAVVQHLSAEAGHTAEHTLVVIIRQSLNLIHYFK